MQNVLAVVLAASGAQATMVAHAARITSLFIG